MKLAIFGATGTSGTELLAHALRDGHELTALARTPSKLPGAHPQLSIVEGNVRDQESVRLTVTGCQAVLSTLGATDKHDTDIRRVGTANIIAAMHESRVARLVALGGFHLLFPGDPDNLGRKLIMPILRVSGIQVKDTIGMAAAIESSGLDWTLVRIPRIPRVDASGRAEIGALRLGPWSKVSRATVASFMLECVANGAYVGQAPMVSDHNRSPLPARLRRPTENSA
jgi:uncharacterized protein YbjT (DUF2867 family)